MHRSGFDTSEGFEAQKIKKSIVSTTKGPRSNLEEACNR
jgi:hypothetical protein